MEHATKVLEAPLRALDAARPAAAAAALAQTLPLALFDEVDCGLVVCDASHTIRFANQAARLELVRAKLLARQGDQLCRGAGAAGDLETALRSAALRGRRSLVRLTTAGDRLMVSVAPLNCVSTDCPLVLVMLGRRRPCSELGLEMLARCFGLTLAERRVLAGLMRDATPREIADENLVALSTVRSQIASTRTKLGARRIEDLLLLLSEVPPLASALRISEAAAEEDRPRRGAPRAVA